MTPTTGPTDETPCTALDPQYIAPSVGAIFEYRGSTYRCNAWLRAAAPPPAAKGWSEVIDALLFEAAFERDGVRFRYCLREEATHVAGSGVCGCLADISSIRVTGRVDWPDAALKEAEATAIRLGRSGRIIG